MERKEFLYLAGLVLAASVLPSCEDVNSSLFPEWLPPVANKYYPIFIEEANKCNLDPVLPAIITLQESGYYSKAESRSGAKGLMQIMPTTAEWMVDKMGLVNCNLYKPRQNIAVGVHYLDYLRNKHQAIWQAVCGYYGKCEGYLPTIKGMYQDRHKKTSDEFDRWLRAVKNTTSKCGGKGALLKCAFKEQKKDYQKWINNYLNKSVQSKGNCITVTKNTLPSLIHPGETLGGIPIEYSDNAWEIWQSLGQPNKMEWCK